MKQTKKELKGFDGWLIFPLIGLILSTAYTLYDIFFVLGGIGYDPVIATIIFFLIDIIFLIFEITCLILFLNKKRSTPKFMIAFYLSNIILIIVLMLMAETYSSYEILVFIANITWIRYFLKSQRVKNTFVN